jgi:hypothetical protein
VTNATPTDQSWPAWKLALRVIDEPAEVFRQLAGRPTAWIPIVLMVVFSAVLWMGLPDQPIQSQTREQLEAAQERAPDRVTDELIAERLERAVSPAGRAISTALQVAYYLVAFLVVAAVLMLVFGTTSSEPIRYKEEFSIVVHAFVPQVIGFLLYVVLARFAGMDQPVLNLGFLVDRESSLFLWVFLSRITLFSAWNVYLLALGNQLRTGAKGIGGALTIVTGLWMLVNLAFAGVASIFAG